MTGWTKKILKSGFKASYSNAFPWLYVAKITPKTKYRYGKPMETKMPVQKTGIFIVVFASLAYCTAHFDRSIGFDKIQSAICIFSHQDHTL